MYFYWYGIVSNGSFLLGHWLHRHINTSFRIITDGSCLCAVFDGPPPFYDALYSKANNFTTDDILHKVLHVKWIKYLVILDLE